MFRNGIYSVRSIKKFRDESITYNIFRIQDNESVMYGFYCIGFKEYMLAGKTLWDYTNLLSPNDCVLRTNMSNLKVRLKKKDERRNYLLDEMNNNDLMSEKYKKTVSI